MICVVWTFDVATDKKDEYIQATAEKIRPAWIASGCDAYELWQPEDNDSTFSKRMFFSDKSTYEEATKQMIENPENKACLDLFRSYAIEPTRRIYLKKL